MKPRTFLLKCHPDFHIPADAVVGEGFDADAYCAKVKAMGADAVAFFGKCHYGHSYYDTKAGHRHPGLKMDMLGEISRAAKRHGLGLVGYYSVFLDTAAAMQHPDWLLKAENTAVDAGFDSGRFQPICVNSPYLEELLIPQSLEIVQAYEIDELLYDTMTGFQPCYCQRCRAKFGKEIPASNAEANWLEYVAWYARQYEEFYAKAAAAVHRVRPRLTVIFNWEWGYKRPADPAPGIGRLTADLISTGTVASLVCRYLAGTGLPYEYMTGRFMHGLGDWNSSTPESLLYTGAATLANGGSFYIIDRQLADGTMEERAYELMGRVFGYFQQRRPWLEGTAHVPEVALVHAYHSVMGEDLRYFPDGKMRQERIGSYEGACRLLVEHGRHFTAVNEQRLLATLESYRVVILPEQEYLSDATVQRLREWVHAGGKLLMTQSAWGGRVDERLMELAGVSFGGLGSLDYGYVGTTPPLLLRGRFADFTAKPDTELLYGSVPPFAAGGEKKKFGHGYAPPTRPDGTPLITSRCVGKGEVIYVGLPFFKAYLDYQNPDQAKLLLELLDRLLPEPIVRIMTPAQVEMTVMRKGDDLVVHLVNHSGRERLGTYWYPVTEYIPEIRDIEVAIRGKVDEAILAPERRPLPARHESGYTRTTVSLHVMQTIHVPGYFGAEK